MTREPLHDDAAGDAECWQLRLYVAGMTPVARRALSNLEALCDAHLPGRYTLVVIDLTVDPQLAEEHQIIAVPTLVRDQPRPQRKVVGDLSSTDRVLRGLGIPAPRQDASLSE